MSSRKDFDRLFDEDAFRKGFDDDGECQDCIPQAYEDEDAKTCTTCGADLDEVRANLAAAIEASHGG
jgi:hypothetical protein